MEFVLGHVEARSGEVADGAAEAHCGLLAMWVGNDGPASNAWTMTAPG